MHVTAWKVLSNREVIETGRERKVFLHRKTINYLSIKSKEG
jgi:tmRNA-binding protein